MIATIFTLGFLAQMIRIAVPYALASMGGAVTERSGVIDLAIESKLLFGAFTAAVVSHATGSALAGLAGGMAAGMIVAALQIACALGFGADQVIVGVGLNLLALGGTRFLLQLLFGESANSPPAAAFGSSVITNPIVWLALVAVFGVPFALRRLRWGVRLRAAGDRPDALVAVGISPVRARLAAALVGGALSGAGGAQLSLSVGGFSAEMSAGRGYIALAMVILSGWRPAGAAVASIGFAFALALSILFQLSAADIPHELTSLLPYVLTLVVLIVAGARRPPPRSLGRE
ncbi:MAG TPA: ABC transporter permease [Kofleriaceae bacterium]|nr:ABC transporter permease [Kofleriaceae bacterium]